MQITPASESDTTQQSTPQSTQPSMQQSASAQVADCQVLVFRVGNDCFGFNVLELDCVCRPLAVSPVLRSAAFFDGMLRLKGVLTPVINLGSLFYAHSHQYNSDTRFVAVKQDTLRLCFVVDQVVGFTTVDESTQQAPPKMIGNEYIACVYHQGSQLILMLDKNKLIDPAEIQQIAQSNRPSLFESSSNQAPSQEPSVQGDNE